MSCNHDRQRSALKQAQFQSLSGFPMSCNAVYPLIVIRIAVRKVSIPIGFSNELQLLRDPAAMSPDPVSIPIGFSNELQQ